MANKKYLIKTIKNGIKGLEKAGYSAFVEEFPFPEDLSVIALMTISKGDSLETRNFHIYLLNETPEFIKYKVLKEVKSCLESLNPELTKKLSSL